MRKIFNLFILMSCSLTFFAQGDLTVFSENGERFTLIVNGESYNQNPETSVHAYDINMEWVKVQVIFEDTKLGSADGNNIIVKPGLETTYMVGLNKKGEYKLKWRGEAPRAARSAAPVAVAPPQPVAPVSGGTTRVTTTTTTTSGVPDGDVINVGINVPGVGGIGISVTDGMMGGSSTVTYSETTTTTTVSGGAAPQPAYQPQPTGNGRCYPMDSQNFNNALGSINSKNFEDSKFTLAKQIASANCLTSAQIAQIMRGFGFENTRLDFAKYAYGLCFDPQNYYTVNDAFEFETSIDELAEYTGK